MTNLKSLIAPSGFALITALFTAFAGQASAEQITLATPDGSIEMTGELIGYNGVDYTVLSSVGVVTISAASVVCDGIKCPEIEDGDLGFTVASLRPEAELIKISD